MNLTFLTSGESPSKELEKAFEDVSVVETPVKNQAENLPAVEERLGKPYDIDDFFLYTKDLKDTGEVLERKRLNSGMLSDDGELLIGDSKISLHYASRLPFKEDSEILIVAPHFEEEYAMAVAYAHKSIGDSIHVLFVTDVPEGSSEKSRDVYENLLGLKSDEYSFIGIPDREVHKNKEKVQSAFKQKIKELNPKNIILPSDGRNFDHKHVLRYLLYVALQFDKNIIYSKSIQSTNLNPTIWEAFDQEHIEKLTSIYSDGKFGNPEYEFQVRNLFAELPEALSRYVASLKSNDPVLDVGAFGYQPKILKITPEKGYRIANLTSIF